MLMSKAAKPSANQTTHQLPSLFIQLVPTLDLQCILINVGANHLIPPKKPALVLFLGRWTAVYNCQQTMNSVVARVPLIPGKTKYLITSKMKLLPFLITNFDPTFSPYLRPVNHFHKVHVEAGVWPGYFDKEYSRPEGTMGYTYTCRKEL